MISRIGTNNISYSQRTASPEIDELTEQNAQSTQEVINQDLNNGRSKEKMEELVKEMNDLLQPLQTSLKFVLHDKLHEYYVTIVDNKTQEVVKEIPSKKLLDVYAAMTEFVGLMVDKKI